VLGQLADVQHIYSTSRAFAAVKADGSVVTWGSTAHGGDSRAVQGQLADVQHIYSTDFAFAAVKVDGSVVTWGSATYGGDSTAVQDQLADMDVELRLLKRIRLRGKQPPIYQ